MVETQRRQTLVEVWRLSKVSVMKTRLVQIDLFTSTPSNLTLCPPSTQQCLTAQRSLRRRRRSVTVLTSTRLESIRMDSTSSTSALRRLRRCRVFHHQLAFLMWKCQPFQHLRSRFFGVHCGFHVGLESGPMSVSDGCELLREYPYWKLKIQAAAFIVQGFSINVGCQAFGA